MDKESVEEVIYSDRIKRWFEIKQLGFKDKVSVNLVADGKIALTVVLCHDDTLYLCLHNLWARRYYKVRDGNYLDLIYMTRDAISTLRKINMYEREKVLQDSWRHFRYNIGEGRLLRKSDNKDPGYYSGRGECIYYKGDVFSYRRVVWGVLYGRTPYENIYLRDSSKGYRIDNMYTDNCTLRRFDNDSCELDTIYLSGAFRPVIKIDDEWDVMTGKFYDINEAMRMGELVIGCNERLPFFG